MTAPFDLVCRRCATGRPSGSIDYVCAACGGELRVRFDERADVSRARASSADGMWRFADWLPISDPASIVSLGEGNTPVVALGAQAQSSLGAASAAMKCEHLNPTGSFKDRVASVAVSIAVERGLPGLAGTSSGNGGAAAAAYCVRAGRELTLFSLSDVAPQKLAQIQAFGARVVLVAGLGHDAASTEAAAIAVARHAAEAGVFPFLTGGRYSPEAMEGAKTIAHELAEQAPATTVVYVPVGGGGLVSAIGRGFAEVARSGAAVPRIVAVQPSGCATLRRALAGDYSGLPGECTTTISGLQVAQLFDGYGAVEAITASGGQVTEVDDEEIYAAQRLLARDSGLLVEPAGATALAGALADARAGRLRASDHVVVLGTGAGYKDSAALARLATQAPIATITVDQISEVLRARA
jgi:threonine synthase